MLRLEYTCGAGEADLALDEALLDFAESAGEPWECLRLWEPVAPLVVVGSSSSVEVEVEVEACRRLAIPILRRPSGGAAIVAGPGCLMYSVVLSYERRPSIRMIDRAHEYVLGVVRSALEPLVDDVRYQGDSDLTIGPMKFSGNSLRCKRTHLLYHGTLLYQFPLDLISTCLRHPPRQPKYRDDRPHDSFVRNLPLSRQAIRDALVRAWNADEPLESLPAEQFERLMAERYLKPEWHFRH